jgi:hypothetical protein
MSAPDPLTELDISPAEANAWWRASEASGAILNRLILAFIAAPIVLVLKEFFAASVAAFALIVPYALLVRYLAVRAVKRRIANDPESLSEFREAGIIRN